MSKTWIIQRYPYVNNEFIFWYLWGDDIGFWYTKQYSKHWVYQKKQEWVVNPNHKCINFANLFPSLGNDGYHTWTVNSKKLCDNYINY